MQPEITIRLAQFRDAGAIPAILMKKGWFPHFSEDLRQADAERMKRFSDAPARNTTA
jgi:hypothetical protein